MSYNISRFSVREIDNFRFEDCTEKDISDISEDFFYNGDGCLGGEYSKNHHMFIIEKFSYQGMGSGRSFDSFKELLRTTKGHIKALVVWESGDYVEYLTVDDGVIKREEL